MSKYVVVFSHLNLSDLHQLIIQLEKWVLLAIERIQAVIGNSIECLVQAIQQNHSGPASMTTQPQEAIERPCKTVQELEELKLKLEGPEQKKEMVC